MFRAVDVVIDTGMIESSAAESLRLEIVRSIMMDIAFSDALLRIFEVRPRPFSGFQLRHHPLESVNEAYDLSIRLRMKRR